MKKINGFTITRLSMSGFKCFEDAATFDMGDITHITASNGQGKSSIADAIAFAFVGTPFFGDRGLDRLQNKNTDEITVSVDFVDNTGNTHNLARVRKRDITAIAYDGMNVKQSHLTEVFGDKDVFLSILNPLYFINVLGDNGKGLLEKLLPIVSHEQVLEALPESSREILEKQSLSSPEVFIKNRRSELKKLEDMLIGLRSKNELIDSQREERTALLDELRTSVAVITEELSELTTVRDSGSKSEEDGQTLAELRKRRDELLSLTASNGAGKAVLGIKDEIRAVEALISQQSATQYLSPCIKEIAQAETKLTVLYDEHTRLNKALSETVIGYKCPTCAVIITAENIDAVKTDLQHRISVLINDGKAAKQALSEIKAKDSTARQEFDDNKAKSLTAERDKLAVLNQRLQELIVASELDSQDYEEQLISLEAQIAEREQRAINGNLSPEQVLRFGELEKEKQDIETIIYTLSNTSDTDYTAKIAKTETAITQMKRLISEAVQYMTKRIELMLAGLKMNNTEIVLTEVIKTTGEIKDCFRFSYDGRDYKCLSLSEKVRAGLEVSVLIQRLSGRKYPIFVDNGESICSFGNTKISGQVMIARVVKGQELQVTYKSREPLKTAA